MAYEQAQIPVQKAEDFELLRLAVERAFEPAAVEKFYRSLEGKGVRVREFEKIVAAGLLEAADPALQGCGRSAAQIYQALSVSDQALMREFFLERIETVDAKIRLKHQRVYRYY
jgi:hypothetical protein